MHLLVLYNVCKCTAALFCLHLADDKADANDVDDILTDYCRLWRGVGLKLGLQASVLGNIEDDYSRQRKRFEKTLHAWMGQYGDNATWGVLELAITNANRVDLGLKPLSESTYKIKDV